MNTLKKQRGDTGWIILFILLIIGAAWYFFFRETPPPVTEATQVIAIAKEQGFFAGVGISILAFLAGGWFVAAGAGWFGFCVFWSLLIFPAAVIGILAELGDPRMTYWWEKSERRDQSYETAVSLIFLVTLFLLNWGGIPIWATIVAWSWTTTAYYVLGYLALGIIWGFIRWDSFAKYLHGRRAEFLQRQLDELRAHLVKILEVRATLRQKLKLNSGQSLPERHENVNRECDALFEESADRTRRFYAYFLGLDPSNSGYSNMIPDEQITSWLVELKNGYPPELAKYFKEQEEKAPEVSANDHKGQIYVWTIFWPLSVGYRIIRKIVTLKFLREIFTFVFNHLRFVYDRIAARHEVKFEMTKRAPLLGSTTENTSPEKDGGISKMPVD